MAQRYGRKRRRAHLEVMRNQQNDLLYLHHLVEKQGRDVRKAQEQLERFKTLMKDWDSDVRHLLGPFSALMFDPQEVSIGFSPFEEFCKVPLPGRTDPVGMFEDMPPHVLEMRVAYLKHCIYTVNRDEKSWGEITTYIRMKISNHKETSFAFTDAYLARMQFASKREIRHLAEHVAETMMRGMKPKKPETGPDTGAIDATRRQQEG